MVRFWAKTIMTVLHPEYQYEATLKTYPGEFDTRMIVAWPWEYRQCRNNIHK